MESSFAVCHARMLLHEGGFSNHPSDPGGVTLNGVTQARYNEYRRWKRLPTRALTPKMAGTKEWMAERDEIYRKFYWIPPMCPELAAGVDAAIYDYAVNSGPSRAIKVLQRLVGMGATGSMTAAVVAAANKRDAKALVAAICDERLAFLKRLKTWPVFGKGWGRRVAEVKSYATKLAEKKLADAPVTPAEGKGEVPDPKVVKGTIKGGGPVVAAEEAVRDGGGWWAWIVSHPAETVLILLLAALAVFIALKAVDRWRQKKQDAPTPGFGVVPEAIP